MNTEDDEFNRIEREAKQRMAAVRYALDKLAEENKRLDVYSVPISRDKSVLVARLTQEELDALNEEPK